MCVCVCVCACVRACVRGPTSFSGYNININTKKGVKSVPPRSKDVVGYIIRVCSWFALHPNQLHCCRSKNNEV